MGSDHGPAGGHKVLGTDGRSARPGTRLAAGTDAAQDAVRLANRPGAGPGPGGTTTKEWYANLSRAEKERAGLLDGVGLGGGAAWGDLTTEQRARVGSLYDIINSRRDRTPAKHWVKDMQYTNFENMRRKNSSGKGYYYSRSELQSMARDPGEHRITKQQSRWAAQELARRQKLGIDE